MHDIVKTKCHIAGEAEMQCRAEGTVITFDMTAFVLYFSGKRSFLALHQIIRRAMGAA
jgi:hypothetical protein